MDPDNVQVGLPYILGIIPAHVTRSGAYRYTKVVGKNKVYTFHNHTLLLKYSSLQYIFTYVLEIP
jgi:hypothetical protein